ncbi:MAG: hypothetical protein HQK83_02755 [Fibrobacteria bacterium]|nr:hypothetical protein [Fibrobacteria bacterium]
MNKYPVSWTGKQPFAFTNLLSILVFMACLTLSPAAETLSNWERVGVVISSKTGLEHDKKLSFAYEDGKRVHNILANMGDIPQEKLFLIQEEGVAAVCTQLRQIAKIIETEKQAGKKIFLQLYYSGHGAHSHFHIGKERLSFKEVKNLLAVDNIDARVFILDVCYGASFFTAKGFTAIEPQPVEVKVDEMTKGEVIITSSAVNEQSYEVKPLKGSIFTSHWLMALRGAGDQDRDGQISLFEAYNYAYHKTVAYSQETLNRPQHPSYDMNLQGGKTLVLTRPLEMSSGLIFKNCPAGEYAITDLGRRLSIGDVYIPPGGDFSLALEKGTYKIQYNPRDESPQQTQIQLATNGLTSLSFDSFTTATPRVASGKGPESSGSPVVSDSPEVSGKKEVVLLPVIRERFRISWTPVRAWSWEEKRIDALNLNSEQQKYFNLQSNYSQRSWSWQQEIRAALSLSPAIAVGVHFLSSSQELESKSTGRDPLNATSTSAAVSLTERFELTPRILGAYLEIIPVRLGKNSLAIDAGAGKVFLNVNTASKLERELYSTTEEKSASYSGEGYQLEAGLKYTRFIPKGIYQLNAELGIRLSGFYRETEITIPGHIESPDIHIPSQEWGVAAGVIFTLSRYYKN